MLLKNILYLSLVISIIYGCKEKDSKIKEYSREYCDCIEELRIKDTSLDLYTRASICNYRMSEKNDMFLKLWFLHSKYPEIHTELKKGIINDEYRDFIWEYSQAIEKQCKCGKISI